MAKKRTRQQKLNTKYPFLYTFSDAQARSASKSNLVKGQFQESPKKPRTIKAKAKKANFLENNRFQASIKKDVTRSLFLASLILALEVVIYLVGL